MRPAGGLTAGAVLLVPVVVVGLLLWVLFFGVQPAQAACTTETMGPIQVAAIPAQASAAGFGRTQLVNAAVIMNAAAELGPDGSAQLLGVQAAIGESSLRNLDHGDGATNPDGSVADSLGLFQQQSSWGTVAERMDPTTAATLFFTRLEAVTGWEQMVPTVAINRVQGNADPDHYAASRQPALAVTTYLHTLPTPTSTGSRSAGTAGTSPTAAGTATGSTAPGVCGGMSGDARTLARALMGSITAGRLAVLEKRHQREIADVAAGTETADCGLDARTLQVIQLALDTFRTAGVSDLNRRCTGSLLGAGTRSSHWIDGGGDAVDFTSLGGTALTGGDPASMRFLQLLDRVVPAGTRAGQVQCRTATAFVHLAQFEDACTHLHIDLAFTDGAPLTPAR